jgi:hypothetical protein
MEIRKSDLPNKKKSKKPWKWTPRKELAAQLLAHSSYCNTELSRRLGISRTTLYAWQQAPEFQERVGNNSKEFKEELKEHFFEEYQVRPNWREEILKKVVHAVEDVNPIELEPMKSTPAALINLALRLQESVDQKERKEQAGVQFGFQIRNTVADDRASIAAVKEDVRKLLEGNEKMTLKEIMDDATNKWLSVQTSTYTESDVSA